MKSVTFNSFAAKPWAEKVFDGDAIHAQVADILARGKAILPQTPRRPDVRLIVENATGSAVTFRNPGNHSGGKPEIIPHDGDARAVMIMLKGDTLQEQQANARTLVARYALDTNGLSAAFIADLDNGKLGDLIAEAYGPAPFAAQADRLTNVDWQADNGQDDTVRPERGAYAAHGARAATNETAFIARFNVYVKGTRTTPERIEGGDIVIAVDHDAANNRSTTRPIAPEVARGYYGAHFARLPVVDLQPDGSVMQVHLPVAKTEAAPARKTGRRNG